MSRLIADLKSEARAEVIKNIGQLRQWLNEDRITDSKKMVTNKQLKYWLLDSLLEDTGG